MKKFWENIKACPLFTMLIVSAVLISAGGYIGAALGIYKADMSFDKPMLSAVLTNETAGKISGNKNDGHGLPDSQTVEDTEESSTAMTENTTEKEPDTQAVGDTTKKPENSTGNTENNTETTEKPEKATENTSEAATEKPTEKPTEEAAINTGGSNALIKRPTEYKKVKTRKSRNSCYGDVNKIALETSYPYIKVDKSYFDDALFVGDSRVEGLALYSGLDNASFAYMEGLTTVGLMTEPIAEGGSMTLEELLSAKRFRKIFIMLGINEAGYDTDTYADMYKKAVDRILELQQDAVVFMIGCMHVSSDYSDANDIVNNDNIDYKNNAIAKYADGIRLFYLDMNTVVDDGRGGLIKEYTWDDVHLQAQYYSLWEQYMYEHGLKDELFDSL